MKRIIVVDDDMDIATLMAGILTKDGLYDVVISNCGNDAICRINNENFDLIILDRVMSPVDGLEVLNALPLEKCSPIIMCTGHSLNQIPTNDARIKRVLLKPFTTKQLLLVVSEVLNPLPVEIKSPCPGQEESGS